MAEETDTTNAVDDPFGLRGEAPLAAVGVLIVGILGMGTLAAYGGWFLSHVWENLGAVIEAEAAALVGVAAAIGGAAPAAVGAIVLGPVAWIVLCILSAIYLTVVVTKWVKKIRREWVWVWTQLSSPSWLDKLLGLFGFVLTLIETIFFVLVTVQSVLIVWVNLKVLIGI